MSTMLNNPLHKGSRKAGAVKPPVKKAAKKSENQIIQEGLELRRKTKQELLSKKVPTRLDDPIEIRIKELKLELTKVRPNRLSSPAISSGVRVPGSIFYIARNNGLTNPLQVRVINHNGYNLARLARLLVKELELEEIGTEVFQRLSDHDISIVLHDPGVDNSVSVRRR